MSAYKQEFVENYWKDDAQVIQESMGFYWAMKSRDFVPFVARVFKKHMYVFQEPSISGSFPNPKLDESTTCFHEFQDWIDLASTKASISMSNKYKLNAHRAKVQYDTKSIIEQNYRFMKGHEKFENWGWYDRRDFVKESLWNFDDEAEAFGYAVKEFAGQLMHKLILQADLPLDYEIDEDDITPRDGFDIHGTWNWKVSEIYEYVSKLEEHNKGLPTRNEDAPEQSDEGLDMISAAMGSDNYLDYVVDYLLKKK